MLDYQHQLGLYTSLAMASHQALGLPQAGHAHFLQHRIDSLTVRGVANPQKTGASRDMLGVARWVWHILNTCGMIIESSSQGLGGDFP